jgi:hypothetical protein
VLGSVLESVPELAQESVLELVQELVPGSVQESELEWVLQ